MLITVPDLFEVEVKARMYHEVEWFVDTTSVQMEWVPAGEYQLMLPVKGTFGLSRNQLLQTIPQGEGWEPTPCLLLVVQMAAMIQCGMSDPVGDGRAVYCKEPGLTVGRSMQWVHVCPTFETLAYPGVGFSISRKRK